MAIKQEQELELKRIRAMLTQLAPTSGSFADRRERWEALYTEFCPTADEISIETIPSDGPSGEWVCAPNVKQATDHVVLYIHGGGFTAGTATAYRGLAAQLSCVTGRPTLNINYRLAPEYPYPAALDDCFSVYEWLTKNQGIRSKKVALVGESAGGNLVAALLVRLRDEGHSLPGAAVCLSPVFDLSLSGDSITSRAERDPCISLASLKKCARAYLDQADPQSPLASPLYANLRGLPPLLIQVGSDEMLRDDGYRLAQKAAAAGVDVTFEEWPNMFHVWHLFAERLRDSRKALETIGEFVRARE